MLHSWGKETDHEHEIYVNSLLTKKVGLDGFLSGLPCGAICSVYKEGMTPIQDAPLLAVANDALLEILEVDDLYIHTPEIDCWIRMMLPEDEKSLGEAYLRVMETGIKEEVLCTLHLSQYKVVKTTFLITRLDYSEGNYTILTTIPNPNSIYSNDRKLALRVQLDPMTGLFNKIAMEQIVKKRLETETSAPFYLGVIDVDNFKNVNDMLGHLFGDEVIQDVANAIANQAPDGSFVGRVGGDEFLVYSDQCSEEEFVNYLRMLCDSTRYEYVCDEGIVSATCSVGYIEGQLNLKQEYEDYFHNADIAMYYAKQRGKAQFYKYESKMRLKRRASDIIASEGFRHERERQYDAEFVATAYGLLSDSKRISTSIEMLLRKIGERFGLKSLRVFEWIPDASGYQIHYGWSKVQRKAFYPGEELMRNRWITRMGTDQSVIKIEDYGKLNKKIQEQLFQVIDSAFVATNLMHSVEVRGFICFEALEQKRIWSAYEVATFEALTKAISAFVFLDKEKQKDRKIIESISKIDEVTGLLKKSVFEISVAEYLKSKSSDVICGMLYVDICKFSMVNERFGYQDGNEVLKILADHFTNHPYVKLACRSHSDCFILLVESEKNGTMIMELEQMLTDSIRALDFNHRAHIIQLKAGLYIIQNQDLNVETIIENANLARKQIISEDGRYIQLYEETFRYKRNQTIQITAEFFDALAKGELMLYLQPVFQGSMQQCKSVEAYAYWKNEEGLLRAPKDFILALEKSGNMEKLDYAVYEMVLQQISEWKHKGLVPPQISINFSIYSCERYGFSSRILRMARQYHVKPEQIQIELSMNHLKNISNVMEKEILNLKKQGFTIAVDHFDTGFEMIKILAKPWLDIVKLDQRLFDGTNDQHVQSQYMNYLRTMTNHPEKMVVIGAETQEQVTQINKSGFDCIQGFVFEKAIPAETFLSKYVEKESVI